MFLLNRSNWFPALFFVFVFASPTIYFSSSILAKNVTSLMKYDQDKSYKGGTDHIFWPGKANAQDPLELCSQMLRKGTRPDSVEWEFAAAKKIVELNGN